MPFCYINICFGSTVACWAVHKQLSNICDRQREKEQYIAEAKTFDSDKIFEMYASCFVSLIYFTVTRKTCKVIYNCFLVQLVHHDI